MICPDGMEILMKRFFFLLLLVMVLVVACQPQPETVTPAIPSEAPTLFPTAEPTPTDEPPLTLTVCTAQLPESLFPYDGLQIPSKSNILALLYEAPFEWVNGEPMPLILERVPSQANGDLRLEAVAVQRGQTVIDSEGRLAVYQPGLQVRPSGCQSAECAVVWDGEQALQLDQMVVSFHLREDLTWSDGTRVTGVDSVFSFQLANDPAAPGLHWAEDRTDAYEALDAQTVQWVGRPGFTSANIDQVFWKPLPAHLFSPDAGWIDWANAEALAVSPLSYGPFTLNSREPAQIQLIPNPNYALANENRALIDVLAFQQIEPDRSEAIQALESGECDLLDSSFGWENDPARITQINSDERFSVQTEVGEAWWQVVFGIVPASYDDGYNPAIGDRPDYFGDPRVRRAFASCLDREAMAEAALGDWGQVWPSFLPPGETQISQGEGILYDPEQGATDLNLLGWLDFDVDPSTPRTAVNVQNIPDGTAFQVELLVDDTDFQQEMAEVIQNSLLACGIGVEVQTLPAGELYAPGPEGPLFGRRFELALIAWEEGPEPDCQFYQSQAIPSAVNQWVGTNIAGLAQSDYDHACASAGLALEDERVAFLGSAERQFLAHLPSVPLFNPPQVLIFAPLESDEELLTAGNGFLKALETLMGE
jgi:peptide/nickel transport system substrate-binding protein